MPIRFKKETSFGTVQNLGWDGKDVTVTVKLYRGHEAPKIGSHVVVDQEIEKFHTEGEWQSEVFRPITIRKEDLMEYLKKEGQ